MDEAVKYNKNLMEFRDLCQRVTEYYLEERYLIMVKSEPTKVEVQEAFNEAKDFIQTIMKGFGR